MVNISNTRTLNQKNLLNNILNGDTVSLSRAITLIESKKNIAKKSTARAPRLKIQQLEEIIVLTEEKANMWEKIAMEYMSDLPNGYQSLNNGGYRMILSELDGHVSGVGMTSLLEHTLGSTVTHLINSNNVTEKTLSNLTNIAKMVQIKF